MDWVTLRTYSGKRKAPKNARCPSPVPGTVVPAAVVGRRSAPRQGLDLLSKRRRQPYAKRQTGTVSAKTLPAIQETSKVDCFSVERSVELNFNENRGIEVKENINEMDSSPSQDSQHLNYGSRESLGNSETSSGMTLPTGVSDFLLECLDSSIDATSESSDGTNIYSSPETFRIENDLETCASHEGYYGCKNSTLLDTSKAINVDKIPPLPNFSNIFENTLEGQDEHFTCDTLSKSKQCCESRDVSTTVAGKQVNKILSSKEKTPKSKSSEIFVLPPKQKKQFEDQQSKSTKFRKKVHFRSFLESTASTSSSVVLASTESKTATPSNGIIAGELASNKLHADMVRWYDMLDLSSVKKAAANEIFSKTISSHLGETIPASPKSRILQYLHHPPDICNIIKASPEFRPPKVVQHPLNREILFPPPGVTRDIITSNTNWICNNDR